ncbi:MAG: hypothetical protein LBK71_05520 [Verrucomicrobiales bacterium]|nr:hypothetical protein [Verrucomicrobiales bacterium]
MHQRLTLLLTLALLTAPAWAQNFQATPPTGATPAQKAAPRPAPGQPLPPRAIGVVVMISAQGLQIINPLAPPSAGDGRQNVTASHVLNPAPADHEDPKPYGGINIIGWEF